MTHELFHYDAGAGLVGVDQRSFQRILARAAGFPGRDGSGRNLAGTEKKLSWPV